MFQFIAGFIAGIVLSQSHLVSLSTLFNLLYNRKTTLTRVKKNIYVLPFTFRGFQYNILLKIRSGPGKYFVAENIGDGKNKTVDVTDRVKSFMGPSRDFFTSSVINHITPEMIGIPSTLKIYDSTDKEYIVAPDDIIPYIK